MVRKQISQNNSPRDIGNWDVDQHDKPTCGGLDNLAPKIKIKILIILLTRGAISFKVIDGCQLQITYPVEMSFRRDAMATNTKSPTKVLKTCHRT